MPDMVVRSLRGGMNDKDSPLSLSDDQCVLAQNIEWTTSLLGERRKGSDNITLGTNIANKDRVSFLFRHLPTPDETAAQLWALGVTGTASSQLSYKDTSWHDITYGPAAGDSPTLTGFSPYRWQGQSLHGKLFLAYDSTVDRLHVWDGTSFRRTGLAEPAAPTATDEGAGTYSGVRYFRVRYVVISGSTVLRRSEPSDILTFTPSGTGAGARVTKPASISEAETHWELEASTGGVNFYRIATTVVGTTTFDDETSYVTDYTAFPLSADIGDYTLQGSARYLVADDDRLLLAGSNESDVVGETANSRVSWTPVYGGPGAGNDERLEDDTDPFVDLDGTEGGAITGMASPVLGGIWVFKQSAIYKLVRTGNRAQAYQAIPYTKKRGAVHGSVIEGADQTGMPCIYFIDPTVGPCRVGGPAGIQVCGDDLKTTFASLNLDASKITCSAVYYPFKKQVQWTIATGTSNAPNVRVVLHTENMRDGDDGARRGWAKWTGTPTGAYTQCLFADNIETNAARSLDLVPFCGIEGNGLVLQTDIGDNDNGVTYAARLVTKPYAPSNVLNQFGIQAGALVATSAVGAFLDIRMTRDFGLESIDVENITLDPSVFGETFVIRQLDNLSMSELHVLQIEFRDPDGTGPSGADVPGARWELQMLAIKQRLEETA